MALCNVTGLVYLMDGSLARSRVLVFQRDRATLAAEYLGTTVPQPVFAKTDPDGAIDVDLLSGVYEIKLIGPRAGYLGRCVVPDAATARLEDIIDADALPDAPPVWLEQVIDARDAAEDAADRADAAATRVEGMEADIDYAVSTAEDALQAGGVTPQRFGAVGDGVADDTAAFQAMANYARANGVPMVVPGGTYSITDTVNLWHPCTLVTEDNAILVFSDMGGMGVKDGFVINLDPDISPDLFNKYRTSRISGFSVYIVGQDGGDFIRTPQDLTINGTHIMNGHAPMYIFENMQINGPKSVIASDISQFSWKNCFNIGAGNGHTVRNCFANGSYNPAIAPTEASTQSCFVKLSVSRTDDESVAGALRSPFITNNVVMYFGRVVDFGRRVSRCQISHFYVHHCWEGFIGDLSNSGGVAEAEEITISNCNINVQRCAISFSGRNNGVQLVDVDCTRAPGQFDHGQDWEGVRVSGPYRLTMTNCGIRHEHVYTNTSYGVRIVNPQSFIVSGLFFKGVSSNAALTYGVHITDPMKVSLSGVHHMLRCDTLVWIGGNKHAATDVTLSGVGFTSGTYLTLANRLVMEGQIGRWCVNDLDERVSTDAQTISFSDGADQTVILTPSRKHTVIRANASNGSMVRFQLDGGARSGDYFDMNLNILSTGGGFAICDSTGAIQASFVRPAQSGVGRYSVRGLYIGVQPDNNPANTFRVVYSGESNIEIGGPFPV